jgi:hypothetical protein
VSSTSSLCYSEPHCLLSSLPGPWSVRSQLDQESHISNPEQNQWWGS